MEELKKRAEKLLHDINSAMTELGADMALQTRDEIRKKMNEPDFWASPLEAQEESKHESRLTKKYEPWQDIKKSVQDLVELASLNDSSMQTELSGQLDQTEKKYSELKRELRFQGPYDDHDVILSIHAGAGGTDAQDWAQMLLRMYVRWAESQGLKVKTMDQSAGEEAGIKSATIEISNGQFLYGKLAGEHGVHRLVRLSPFNADHLRQTSFAKVEILPVTDKPGELQLDEKDLRIDVFRSGGHGGQSVNTTDSAVRVTHLPTGIVVSMQNERSQLQNKETALNILRSKLIQLQLEQHAKSLADIKGPNQSAEWGNQIRSYVLHPYKQVKDNRSGYESSDVEKVLDGNLDPLITAWLEQNSVN
ncbi:MAG TPA: peptide chain release factor 2 [Candidatus Nitrosopolaris sp.]|nr:peptide chain release factor 2 [Candidatus Nitrosopolaris sp.]